MQPMLCDSTLPTALILAGGTPPGARLVQDLAPLCRQILAADRGLLIALQHGLSVNALLGDLDSLPSAIAQQFTQATEATLPSVLQSYRIQALEKHPCEKNESDLELALQWAHRASIRQCFILGALGGRLDHELFNVLGVLSIAHSLGLRAVILDETTQVTLLGPGSYSINNYRDRTLSLIPLSPSVTLSLDGMRYPLYHETLSQASTRGLSNIICSHKAVITITSGSTLVVMCSQDTIDG